MNLRPLRLLKSKDVLTVLWKLPFETHKRYDGGTVIHNFFIRRIFLQNISEGLFRWRLRMISEYFTWEFGCTFWTSGWRILPWPHVESIWRTSCLTAHNYKVYCTVVYKRPLSSFKTGLLSLVYLRQHTSVSDHNTQKTPVLVRSPTLNSLEPG